MQLRLLICLFVLSAWQKAAAQIVNIEEQRITGTNDSTHWYGHLRAAFNLSKVRETALQWNAESKVQYKNRRHLSLLLLNYDLVKAGDNDFVNSAFAHLRYNFKLTDPLVWEGFAQVQTNKLLLIRTRMLFGTGLRHRFFLTRNQRSRVYLGASWMWEQNDFTGDNASLSWHRLSSYASTMWRFGKNQSLIGTVYWQPVFGFIKNYRVLADLSLNLPLSRHLSFVLDFTYSKETGLPVAAPQETVIWKNGLTWRLN